MSRGSSESICRLTSCIHHTREAAFCSSWRRRPPLRLGRELQMCSDLAGLGCRGAAGEAGRRIVDALAEGRSRRGEGRGQSSCSRRERRTGRVERRQGDTAPASRPSPKRADMRVSPTPEPRELSHALFSPLFSPTSLLLVRSRSRRERVRPGRSGPIQPCLRHPTAMLRLPRPRRALLRPPLSPSTRTPAARAASRKSNPWPEPKGAAETPSVRTWVYPVSRIANFLIVPSECRPLARRACHRLTHLVSQLLSSMLSSSPTLATTNTSSCRYVSTLAHSARQLTPSVKPRRWLAAQKAAFFSLTPEEQKLAGVDTPTSETPAQGSGTHRWYALRPTRYSS